MRVSNTLITHFITPGIFTDLLYCPFAYLLSTMTIFNRSGYWRIFLCRVGRGISSRPWDDFELKWVFGTCIPFTFTTCLCLPYNCFLQLIMGRIYRWAFGSIRIRGSCTNHSGTSLYASSGATFNPVCLSLESLLLESLSVFYYLVNSLYERRLI